MTERLSDKVREYLSPAQGRTVYLKDIRTALRIEPGSKDDQNLRVLMAVNLVKDHTVKPSGKGDGGYKVIVPIDPIRFSLDGTDEEGIIDFKFPRSYIDDTAFNIEDLVEVSEGDMVGIFGETNMGKSCIAHSILGENLGLFTTKPLLMGNELTTSQDEIMPKIKRRLRRMDWVQWEDEKGEMRFDIMPVGADYEEYIRRDAINVIDWITLPGEYWMIDSVLKTMKDVVGKGVLVPVLQKKKHAEDPEGGERAKRHCDVELRIDSFGTESILTIGKVKSAKTKASGRMWAFDIMNYGANLVNIREVVKCSNCWGKGYVGTGGNYKRCQSCEGRKYVNKESNA